VTIVAGLTLAVLLGLATILSAGNDHAARHVDKYARPAMASAAPLGPLYPSSMDALGDSVTVGYNTGCPDPWVDCLQNSWATGTNAVVHSVYQRLLALNSRLKDHSANDAESGATVAELDSQARRAVRRGVELVLIAVGTNDACGGRTGKMTDVSVFRDEFERAMAKLATGLPRARVHVVSIPDLYHRWETLHTVPDIVRVWRSIPFCPTLLDRPTSHAPADLARRASVRARILAFNAELAQVCSQHRQCTTDAGAAFRAEVDAAQLSTHDYWHPDVVGQSALARLAWDGLGYQS
jgi:lysophospholipase L1-like esterase